MSIISVVSATYCHEDEVIQGVVDRTGLQLVTDHDLVARAAGNSGMSEAAIAKAFSAKRSVFNSFTRERERTIACLKVAVAETVARDEVVLAGFCAHLVPSSISHVSAGLPGRRHDVADLAPRRARIRSARRWPRVRSAVRTRISRRGSWTTAGASIPGTRRSTTSSCRPTRRRSTMRSDSSSRVSSSEAVQPTAESRQAVDDFLVGARVENALAAAGHHVEVSCVERARDPDHQQARVDARTARR